MLVEFLHTNPYASQKQAQKDDIDDAAIEDEGVAAVGDEYSVVAKI